MKIMYTLLQIEKSYPPVHSKLIPQAKQPGPITKTIHT